MKDATSRISAVLACALLAALAIGCSEKSAGSTTETTNGTVALVGVATLSSGAPAKGALVRLIDDERWAELTAAGETPVLDSAVADETGSWRVEGISGRVNLQIDADGEALLLRDVGVADSVVSVDAELEPASSLEGNCEGSHVGLALAGTAYGAVLKGSSYSFPAVAAGAYVVVALHEAEGDSSAELVSSATLEVEPGDSLVRDLPETEPRRLLFDDFEDPDNLTAVARAYGIESGWYRVSGDSTEIHTAYLVDSALGTSYLWMQSVLTREDDPEDWTILGAYLRPDEKEMDLSGLKTIEFMARGTGVYDLSLYSGALDQPENIDHFIATFTPESDRVFGKVVIPVSDLRLDERSIESRPELLWENAAKRIKALRFIIRSENGEGTFSLAIDDVVLTGVTLADFAD